MPSEKRQGNRVGLHVATPTLPDFDKILPRLRAVWDSGNLTNGSAVKEFERSISETIPNRHIIAVNSCTSGLMLALRVLDVSGEVLIPSFTFTASAHAVVWNGCVPVWVDIDSHTLNMDVDDLERKITPRTSAILAVYVSGNPPAIERLEALAAKHNLKLIFDAAHALGSTYQGKPAGSFGDAEIFSLSPTKTITTCEGGIVSVRDAEVARKFQIGRNYANPGNYNCEFFGLNARMSELHAVVGIESFQMLQDNVTERRRLVDLYEKKLATVPGVLTQQIGAGNECSYKDFTVRIVANDYGSTREALREELAKQGIETRTYFDPPVHEQDAYLPWRNDAKDLKGTDEVKTQVLNLPLYVGLSNADVDQVVGVIREFAAKSAVSA